jgi:hypothetical protein
VSRFQFNGNFETVKSVECPPGLRAGPCPLSTQNRHINNAYLNPKRTFRPNLTRTSANDPLVH